MVDYTKRPKIGTFVIWRFKSKEGIENNHNWENGITYGRMGSDKSNGVVDMYQQRHRFQDIEYKVIDCK